MVSGTLISHASNRSYAVVEASTEAMAFTPPPAFTIKTQVVTANSLNRYVVASQTLGPRGAFTVAGTRITIASGVTDVVVGMSTEASDGFDYWWVWKE